MSLASSQQSSSIITSSIPNFDFSIISCHSNTPQISAKSMKFKYLDLIDNFLMELQTIFDKAFDFAADLGNELMIDCRLDSIEMFYEKFLKIYKKKITELLWLKLDSLNRTMGNLDFFRHSLFPGKTLCEIKTNFDKSRENFNYFEHFIEIRDLLNEKKWGFYLRYSKIAIFHDQIKREVAQTPSFPGKKFFHNLEKGFLLKRSLELTTYFNGLMENKSCLEKGRLREWVSFHCQKEIEDNIKMKFQVFEWKEIFDKTFFGSTKKKSHFFEILKENVDNELNKMKTICEEIRKEIVGIERNHSIELFLGDPIKKPFT